MRRQIAYQLGKKNQATFRAMHPEKGMDPLNQIHAMAYLAAQRMEQILSNEAMPDRAKMQVIDMILDRTYGSPETTMKIRNAMDAEEQSMARMERIIGGFSIR
jgi:hypothetical protein